jgi:Ca2+/Na+ antiporter
MQQKKQKIIQNSIIFLSILIFGILLGKFLDWPYLKLDQNVNLVDLISVLLTLLLAYFVVKVIEKEKEDYREEKNLLLKRLERIDDLIEEIHESIESDQIHYSKAAAMIKNISVNLNCLFRVKLNPAITIDRNTNQVFTIQLKRLRNLLTNTPMIDASQINKSDLPLEVKSGILKISKSRVIEIETELEKLRILVFELQLKINAS